MNGRALGNVVEQSDLGMQVHSLLKVISQAVGVVIKAFSTLAIISQSIEYRSWDVLLQLYKTLARPHLEYYIQFWIPCYRKDVVKLKRVLLGLKGLLSYRERVSRLGLFPGAKEDAG